MTILTIPKEMQKKDLVLIPRDEYEQLVDFRQHKIRVVEEEEMSPAARRSLARMRKARAAGKMIPFRKS